MFLQAEGKHHQFGQVADCLLLMDDLERELLPPEDLDKDDSSDSDSEKLGKKSRLHLANSIFDGEFYTAM